MSLIEFIPVVLMFVGLFVVVNMFKLVLGLIVLICKVTPFILFFFGVYAIFNRIRGKK